MIVNFNLDELYFLIDLLHDTDIPKAVTKFASDNDGYFTLKDPPLLMDKLSAASAWMALDDYRGIGAKIEAAKILLVDMEEPF